MQDEASAGYDAYSILTLGKDHHGMFFPVTFQAFNDWIAHTYVYLLVPFVKIWGLTSWTIRFAPAIFSIVSIFLFYFLVKTLTKRTNLSFLASFLYAFSWFSITISRWSIPPNIVPIFIILSLLLFFKFLNKSRIILSIITGSSLGLAAYSYPSVEGILPVWLISVFVYSVIRRKRLKKGILLSLVLLIALYITSYLPLFINHLLNPKTITNRLTMISVSSLTDNPVINYLGNYLSYFLPSPLFLGGEVNPTRTVPGFGYENPVLGLFFYTGIIFLFFNKKILKKYISQLDDLNIFALKMFVLLFPLVPSLTLPGGDFQRATHFLPILILISSLGIYLSLLVFRSLIKKNRVVIISLTVTVIIAYLSGQFAFFREYFGEKYKGINQWYFQNGMDKVVEYASGNESKYQNIIIDSTINQPYIYFLFYKKFDPKQFTPDDYKDFSNVDPQTNWLKVEKFRNYIFRKLSVEDLAGAELINSIYNSPYSTYSIYESSNNLIVKFELKLKY